LLVLLTALAIAVLAPAFHYHQFGEATRMARDAGFSALFACGGVVAVFGTIRTFRREIESGTLAMALAHPVSRARFFLSKAAGALTAYLAFAAVVFMTSLVIVDGAAVGGEIARRTGDVARLWGPSLVQGVGVIVLPLVIAAALNRFGRFRFVLSSIVLSLFLSSVTGTLAAVRAGSLVLRLAPVAVLVILQASVLLAASAALAVRFRSGGAASAAGLVFILFLPAIGNYYLPEALSGGRCVSWGYVALAALALLPMLGLFLWAGVFLINRRSVI